MSGVVIQHGRVAVANLSKVVQNDDLGGKDKHSSGGFFLELEATYPRLKILLS